MKSFNSLDVHEAIASISSFIRKLIKLCLYSPNKLFSGSLLELSYRSVTKAETLSKQSSVHVAKLTGSNAGDILLPTVIRDLFDQIVGRRRWKLVKVNSRVTRSTLNTINSSQFTVIGGGGLFLSDSRSSHISGWQWPISLEQLSCIESKLIVFSVGFNQFKGQQDFNEEFTRSINCLIDNSLGSGTQEV